MKPPTVSVPNEGKVPSEDQSKLVISRDRSNTQDIMSFLRSPTPMVQIKAKPKKLNVVTITQPAVSNDPIPPPPCITSNQATENEKLEITESSKEFIDAEINTFLSYHQNSKPSSPSKPNSFVVVTSSSNNSNNITHDTSKLSTYSPRREVAEAELLEEERIKYEEIMSLEGIEDSLFFEQSLASQEQHRKDEDDRQARALSVKLALYREQEAIEEELMIIRQLKDKAKASPNMDDEVKDINYKKGTTSAEVLDWRAKKRTLKEAKMKALQDQEKVLQSMSLITKKKNSNTVLLMEVSSKSKLLSMSMKSTVSSIHNSAASNRLHNSGVSITNSGNNYPFASSSTKSAMRLANIENETLGTHEQLNRQFDKEAAMLEEIRAWEAEVDRQLEEAEREQYRHNFSNNNDYSTSTTTTTISTASNTRTNESVDLFHTGTSTPSADADSKSIQSRPRAISNAEKFQNRMKDLKMKTRDALNATCVGSHLNTVWSDSCNSAAVSTTEDAYTKSNTAGNRSSETTTAAAVSKFTASHPIKNEAKKIVPTATKVHVPVTAAATAAAAVPAVPASGNPKQPSPHPAVAKTAGNINYGVAGHMTSASNPSASPAVGRTNDGNIRSDNKSRVENTGTKKVINTQHPTGATMTKIATSPTVKVPTAGAVGLGPANKLYAGSNPMALRGSNETTKNTLSGGSRSSSQHSSFKQNKSNLASPLAAGLDYMQKLFNISSSSKGGQSSSKLSDKSSPSPSSLYVESKLPVSVVSAQSTGKSANQSKATSRDNNEAKSKLTLFQKVDSSFFSGNQNRNQNRVSGSSDGSSSSGSGSLTKEDISAATATATHTAAKRRPPPPVKQISIGSFFSLKR